ncbi:MAG TPA: Ig-like domain-containing protein [Polyangiaceae bacterium]|nr:Ig-like domain-containing protein [Polyangiaceae bacterium]
MIFSKWQRSRGLWTFLACLGLVAACMHGAKPAKPGSGGTLSLLAEQGGSEKPQGSLRVVFGSPQGDVALVTELSVVFDRPVQALGLVSQVPAPFRITPEVPGQFRWVGSRAAVFTPQKRLAFATRYTVEVPAGLQAVDGTRLEKPYRFELETLRPRLNGSQPHSGERGLGTDTQLRLELNQQIAPAALQVVAKLEVRGPRGSSLVPFEVLAADKQPRALIVKPKRALPAHAAITLTLASGLRGVEGPLEAGVLQTVSFNTYEPLTLEEVSCARDREGGACSPESAVSLVFNNAVRLRDLAGKLHVTPDVGLKPTLIDPSEADAATTYVPLIGRFRAGQAYRVQIDAGVGDRFGQKLARPISASFRFEDHHPRVDIGAVGRNFGGRGMGVPVASRNVASFELLTAPLSPSDLLSWLGLRSQGGRKDADLEWLGKLGQTQTRRISPQAAKNQIDRLLVDAAKVLGASGRGALAIGARYQRDRDDWNAPEAMKVLNLSDLGISAKLSRFGSLVWITDRTSNVSVAGAEVALYVPGRPERKYTTDSEGLAHVPAADFAPNLESQDPEARAILVARRGADSAFAPVSELIEGWRLDVPTDFSGALPPYGVAFTDRGIYRPGDELMVKGIVRSQVPTGNALPGEKPVTITLRSPSGDDLSSQPAMLSEYGTFSSKLRVPSGAELGTYYVAVSGLGSQRFLEQSLQVAEYRPVELRVEALSDKPSYVRGESAALEVKASYLFGAPASGGALTLNVSRQPTWFAVPGAETLTTDASLYYYDIAETSAAGELRRESRKLDDQGRVSWSEKLELPGQRGTELLRIDAEVADVSRRTVATSSSALVHPAAFYVGLKADAEGFVTAPAMFQPRVMALDPSGRRLAGKRVALELIERRYSYARESSGDGYRSVSKPIDRQVARCDVTTGAEPATCGLAVPAAGYYLVVARSKDERGNLAESAISLYAAGAGEPTWQDSDRRSVPLVLDKKSYKVGQRARVLVKSPYREAEALITVERSGVYHSLRRVLHGTAPSFEIPVTAELLPNAFVGVQLLPRRTGKEKALEAGSYRVGYANLLVNGEARRLSVAITPNKRDFRPGENIDVKLAVKDARGAVAPNTELTLYAADEGVLSLIDYRTPDPLAVFSGVRALQVATLESRDAEGRILLESLGSGQDKGRDGGGGGESDVRRDFRQTAYFNPRIISDARGEAKVSFKLPEGLTTYRLMAVAVGRDDRYGFTQDRVTTSKPLMARPALPRFLRAGDELEVGVVVSKKRLASGKVRVTARLTGLQASGPLERELEVPENGSIEVRFPAKVPHPGTASVRFEVSGSGERDAVTQTVRIQPPMTPEAAAIYGQTGDAQTERLGALDQARDDVGELSVALASTALVGLDQSALDLIEYPYSCTEQLASRIIPLIALGDLSKALGFELPPDARKRAESAAREVLARQQGDGGFGMWPESTSSSEWVSPWATLALSRAARAGITVPKHATERAREYLRRVASGKLSRQLDLATAALALDVLAELGAPDAGGVNRLFERRKGLPLFGKALLLHAAVASKLGSDVAEVLSRELENSLHLSADRALAVDDAGAEYGALLDSQARTQALVLRALAARGKHPLLSELVRGLLGSRKQGRFRTTQEGAWALLSLDDYRRVAEAEAPRFEASLSLGTERLGHASFQGGSAQSQRFEVPLARLLGQQGRALLFEKQGSGKLFYEARLRYVRRELPKTPIDAGLYVEKSLRSVRLETLGKGAPGAPAGIATELGAGDWVLVDLTVVAPAPREYVVIDDPLPAGLEAIDPKLFTSADWLSMSGFGENRSCEGCQAGDIDAVGYGAGDRPHFERSEVRDDRVLFFVDQLPAGLFHYRYLARATGIGRFVLPPTRAEEMYQPETFGRTGAAEVTIR